MAAMRRAVCKQAPPARLRPSPVHVPRSPTAKVTYTCQRSGYAYANTYRIADGMSVPCADCLR